MIDTFDRAAFEAALPSVARQPLWSALGLVAGEHCYVIPIKPGVLIYIRSSVDASGFCAETGWDSIRCWLAADATGKPLGGKCERWISRVSGWQNRMTETLRTLWRLGRKLKPCPDCGVQLHALKVKKPGPNHGRFFASCPSCRRFDEWLTPPTQKEIKDV